MRDSNIDLYRNSSVSQDCHRSYVILTASQGACKAAIAEPTSAAVAHRRELRPPILGPQEIDLAAEAFISSNLERPD